MKPVHPTSPEPSQLARQAASLRLALQGTDPAILARHTSAIYQPSSEGQGGLLIPLLGEIMWISIPDLIAYQAANGEEAPLATQALLLYHLTTAKGSPPAGRWVSFSELTDGRFYNQAFQGYSGGELARTFGSDLARFERAAERLGGDRQSFADATFAFQALPRVPLLAAAWLGDEDFPPSYQILFDASVNHQLPTDVCAILGGTLARKLIRAMKALES